MSNNNNNDDDAKRPYRILRGGNSLVSSYTVNNARALATDKVNKNIGTRHAVVLLRSYIGSYYSYSIYRSINVLLFFFFFLRRVGSSDWRVAVG